MTFWFLLAVKCPLDAISKPYGRATAIPTAWGLKLNMKIISACLIGQLVGKSHYSTKNLFLNIWNPNFGYFLRYQSYKNVLTTAEENLHVLKMDTNDSLERTRLITKVSV